MSNFSTKKILALHEWRYTIHKKACGQEYDQKA